MFLQIDKLMKMERNNNTDENAVREIRWKGLTDKNSDKLYAPKQLLPQSDYDMRDKEIFERRVTKYRKLLDGAKEGIK